MRSIKTVLLGATFAAATAISAIAAPLTGSFNMVGQFQVENNAGTSVPFGSGTAIDFCGATTGACTTSPGAGTGTGAFLVTSANSGNLGIGAGDVGTVRDIIYNPFTGPVTDFYTVGDLAFDLTALTFSQFNLPSGAGQTISFLSLSGSGLLRRDGFDDTFATFSFTGQTDGIRTVGQFSFSGASAALGNGPGPGPGPIPEPASLAIFGAGLLGLGFARRRLARNAA
ncbi:PEP-CTERM sorting domain-containing protein [Roseomonas sp. CCTCC AB2023176]|uniref:PEP-CTERM sorting domain-containing protein n=1 Tax=Roseomonas sp. CCTCC AB2023176 TaxID=3342640 RepID=UPI0035E0B1DC